MYCCATYILIFTVTSWYTETGCPFNIYHLEGYTKSMGLFCNGRGVFSQKFSGKADHLAPILPK